MALINTNDYNVWIDIPDKVDIVFNTLVERDIPNLENYIKNLTIPNDNNVIILWAAANRIELKDRRLLLLNDFYRQIKNPLILFNGALNQIKPDWIDFTCQDICMLQYASRISHPIPRTINLNKDKKYLFTSTKDYLSRTYILQTIINGGFSNQGTIAYKCLQNYRNTEPFLNTADIKSACESIDHLLPITGFDNGHVYNYNIKPNEILDQTYLSILTETYYQGPMFLSEKIFDAMLYNHFFIYLGPPYTLEYLRNMGFKTFGHIIDESYDTIIDPVNRLYAVAKSVKEFLSKPLNEMNDLYIENLELIEYNRDLVLDTELNRLIANTIDRAIQEKSTLIDK